MEIRDIEPIKFALVLKAGAIPALMPIVQARCKCIPVRGADMPRQLAQCEPGTLAQFWLGLAGSNPAVLSLVMETLAEFQLHSQLRAAGNVSTQGGKQPVTVPVAKNAPTVSTTDQTASVVSVAPVTESFQKERMGVCAACDCYLDGRCQVCGCNLVTKTAVAHQSCPLKKWAAVADPPLPSLGTMAKNVVGAVIRDIKSGRKRRTELEAKAIRQICKGIPGVAPKCPSYRKSDKRCSECGCWIEEKSQWAAEHCPLGKW